MTHAVATRPPRTKDPRLVWRFLLVTTNKLVSKLCDILSYTRGEGRTESERWLVERCHRACTLT